MGIQLDRRINRRILAGLLLLVLTLTSVGSIAGIEAQAHREISATTIPTNFHLGSGVTYSPKPGSTYAMYFEGLAEGVTVDGKAWKGLDITYGTPDADYGVTNSLISGSTPLLGNATTVSRYWIRLGTTDQTTLIERVNNTQGQWWANTKWVNIEVPITVNQAAKFLRTDTTGAETGTIDVHAGEQIKLQLKYDNTKMGRQDIQVNVIYVPTGELIFTRTVNMNSGISNVVLCNERYMDVAYVPSINGTTLTDPNNSMIYPGENLSLTATNKFATWNNKKVGEPFDMWEGINTVTSGLDSSELSKFGIGSDSTDMPDHSAKVYTASEEPPNRDGKYTAIGDFQWVRSVMDWQKDEIRFTTTVNVRTDESPTVALTFADDAVDAYGNSVAGQSYDPAADNPAIGAIEGWSNQPINVTATAPAVEGTFNTRLQLTRVNNKQYNANTAGSTAVYTVTDQVNVKTAEAWLCNPSGTEVKWSQTATIDYSATPIRIDKTLPVPKATFNAATRKITDTSTDANSGVNKAKTMILFNDGDTPDLNTAGWIAFADAAVPAEAKSAWLQVWDKAGNVAIGKVLNIPRTPYTVEFHDMNPTDISIRQTVNAGSKVVVPTKPASQTVDSYAYDFADTWYTDEACTIAWNFDTALTDANTTEGKLQLYSKWKMKSACAWVAIPSGISLQKEDATGKVWKKETLELKLPSLTYPGQRYSTSKVAVQCASNYVNVSPETAGADTERKINIFKITADGKEAGYTGGQNLLRLNASQEASGSDAVLKWPFVLRSQDLASEFKNGNVYKGILTFKITAEQ